MKKLFQRPGLVAMAGVLSLAILFSACKKNDESQSISVSGLMAYNLLPDKGNVGFSLDGNTLTYNPLPYGNYTGYYLNVYPGGRTVEAFDQNGLLTTTAASFEANKYYSAFLLGANGSYRIQVVNDKLDTLTAPNGVAYIRYLNAVPDSSKPVIAITANGTTIASNNAGFGAVSDFVAVAPGQVTVTAANEGSINVNRTITLESKKVYTVLLQGLPGQADADKSVQIRYIVNGTVTP